MFGHDDNEQMTQGTGAQGAMSDTTLGTTATSVAADSTATGEITPPATTFAPTTTPSEAPEDVAASAIASVPTVASTTPQTTATLDAPDDDADDLLQIKQEALQQLSPLVGHLDQSPEEKFRTTMMMIQASDNKDLIKDAYTAAQQIEDEKLRAQALLDIVNEINYFTQQQQA